MKKLDEQSLRDFLKDLEDNDKKFSKDYIILLPSKNIDMTTEEMLESINKELFKD